MSDELVFADESDDLPLESEEKFKVLIVDDEPEVHKVTELALTGYKFEGYGIELLNAYSGKQAQQILSENKDIAVILLDVVMESEHAGLELVDIIRNQFQYNTARIILRTGQPGQAPEQEVIEKYDINDYKSKTELTAQKLYTLMHASLRSYRDMEALEQSKAGLRKVIEASKGIFEKHAFSSFITGTLQQLVYLLNLDEAYLVSDDLQAYRITKTDTNRLASLNQYGVDQEVSLQDIPLIQKELLEKALTEKHNIYLDEHILLYCDHKHFITVFYIRPRAPLSPIDQELINIFSENITLAMENIHLEEEVKQNQKEIVYRLGEIVENRSKETGNHVKRVALYSELLAKLYGLEDEEVETIKLASPLHDIGKIAIPDSILHKPGKLDGLEWQEMQSHASRGGELLAGSEMFLLKAGSIIASTHHEKWDGSGYPNGTSGEDIPIFGRITALADVFDALCNKRCYKEAWDVADVIDYIMQQSGKQFDPKLVQLLLDNLELFEKIRKKYQD